MVAAGIVLYNPDVVRLKENLEAITRQVDLVILIDNNSKNLKEIEELIKYYNNIKIISNFNNEGVARALNQIMDFAYRSGVEWVLTLDQDSVVYPNLIVSYLKYINIPRVGLMTCRIEDRNFEYEPSDVYGDYIYIQYAITSGSFISVRVWKELNGFDEILFIDGVDTDYCIRLRLCNFLILKINQQGIKHEVGNKTRRVKVLGKNIVVFNHKPFRCYYIVRNQIYLVRKYRNLLDDPWKRYRSAYHRILIYMFFENNRMKKVKESVRGLIHGHIMKVSRFDSKGD